MVGSKHVFYKDLGRGSDCEAPEGSCGISQKQRGRRGQQAGASGCCGIVKGRGGTLAGELQGSPVHSVPQFPRLLRLAQLSVLFLSLKGFQVVIRECLFTI